jgi:phenylalanyl-tRNA synthetase beta chain
MPKIEVNEKLFMSLLGRTPTPAALEEELVAAKAELDEWKPGEGDPETRTIKIELNDTNRPDLWSTAGVARQLRVIESRRIPSYPFFSREGERRPATRRVEVEASVQAVRPYLAGFIAKGMKVSDPVLKDLIQTQEKLCWNYGRKRRSISMGVYRSSAIEWPVSYKAVDPDKVSFVPLQESLTMTLRQILAEHPKGKEYGFILEREPLHPLLLDRKGGILSYPPIINSADLGAVQVGDDELFIELTGSDLPSLSLTASIVACDLADLGFAIEPVEVLYPYDTAFGRSITYPYYFQQPATLDAGRASRLLGRSINIQDCAAACERMGSRAEIHGQFVAVHPAEYRNDFLHAVDLVEDVMIGLGMGSFTPERPRDFTIGRLSPVELFSRKAKGLLVGLGFQEMIYNYLGSGKNFAERMRLDPAGLVRISNPMSENFEYLRSSPLSCLLESESVSSRAVYPHRLFEVGKVALLRPAENYGVATRQYLGFLNAHAAADFNEVAGQVATLLYYLGRDFEVAESAPGAEASVDPRFIPGRQAVVLHKGQAVGIYGEIHPEVLGNWGISLPCAAAELDLDLLLA